MVAVAAGKLNEDGRPIPMELKQGSHVLFGKYLGNETMTDSLDLNMREDHILVIENNK